MNGHTFFIRSIGFFLSILIGHSSFATSIFSGMTTRKTSRAQKIIGVTEESTAILVDIGTGMLQFQKDETDIGNSKIPTGSYEDFSGMTLAPLGLEGGSYDLELYKDDQINMVSDAANCTHRKKPRAIMVFSAKNRETGETIGQKKYYCVQ